MISSESRMRENRTSGLMRGGLETRLREPDCGPERKRRISHRTLKLARQPPTLLFNKLKQFRRIATRYEKLAANYLAMIKLATIRIWLRANESTP